MLWLGPVGRLCRPSISPRPAKISGLMAVETGELRSEWEAAGFEEIYTKSVTKEEGTKGEWVGHGRLEQLLGRPSRCKLLPPNAPCPAGP